MICKSREILFRGRATRDYMEHYASDKPYIKKGDWLFGNLVKEKSKYCNGYYIKEIEPPFRTHGVDPSTVGQLATLDKHNDIIFDGDILQDPEIPDEHWLVYFEQKELLWSVKEVTTGEKMSLAKLLESDPEVIGNKWDNPELLEVLGDDQT